MRKAYTSAARRTLRSRALHARHSSTIPSVKVSTLQNKIRVATEDVPGHFAGVGIYVDAGSRYETQDNLGVSHFLDRMAFKVCGYLYMKKRSVLTDYLFRALADDLTSKCLLQYTPLVVKSCVHRRGKP